MEKNNWPVDIVVEMIVAAQSNEGPQPQAVGEEDLSGCIHPDLRRRSQKRSAAEGDSVLQVHVLQQLSTGLAGGLGAGCGAVCLDEQPTGVSKALGEPCQ